jgi:hypothetical protein
MQPGSRERISKHVPAPTNTNTAIELLLQSVFYVLSMQSGSLLWGKIIVNIKRPRQCPSGLLYHILINILFYVLQRSPRDA